MIPVLTQVCLSANSGERERAPGPHAVLRAPSRGSEEGDLGLGPAPSFWASVLSPRQPQASPSYSVLTSPRLLVHLHMGSPPTSYPWNSSGKQSLSPALPSCGSREHPAGATASGRQAAAETSGSWRRGSAPPPEDSQFFLIRSGPGGEGPGEERAGTKPPQNPGPPQPTLV